MIRSTLVLAVLAATSVGVAAEPRVILEAGDEQLVEKLLGEDPIRPAGDGEAAPGTEVPKTPAAAPNVASDATGRIAERLREAGKLLAGGETGTATRAAQQGAIDELTRLIEEAKKEGTDAPGRPPGSGAPQAPENGSESSGPESSEGETVPGADAAVPAGEPNRNRQGKAEESSDRPPEGAVREAARDFRRELVRDAWGHLPPRLRDQLLNASSDESLPQYDAMVRRYFESLAQPDPPKP